MESKAAGRKEGELWKLINQTCRKLLRGKEENVIAEELEEDPALIRRICAAAHTFAPDYDTEKIYAAMQVRNNHSPDTMRDGGVCGS